MSLFDESISMGPGVRHRKSLTPWFTEVLDKRQDFSGFVASTSARRIFSFFANMKAEWNVHLIGMKFCWYI